MSQEIEKANIVITRVTVASEGKDFFVEWQSKLQDVIANFPGFLSLEILAPNEQQTAWMVVQRFSDPMAARHWKLSPERKVLFDELYSIYKEGIEEVSSEEQTLSGVTEVIITEVVPEKNNFYRQWLSKIHEAEARLPGFRGMYVQTPIKGQGRYWVTFLQFDTSENLDKWLNSPVRQEILKELGPLIKAFESHRIISPYAGWFGSIAKIGAMPPLWKQTMLVLLVLFPIVMMEFKYLNPLTKALNLSLGTFIGNAISVMLISWPMMPIAIFLFGWWLTPQAWNWKKINVLGTLILLGIYLVEIILFWHFI